LVEMFIGWSSSKRLFFCDRRIMQILSNIEFDISLKLCTILHVFCFNTWLIKLGFFGLAHITILWKESLKKSLKIPK